MSVHVAASISAADVYLLARLIREPTAVSWSESTATATFTFTPDLSVADAATFTDAVAAARSRNAALSDADYAALKPFLATGRSFLALSQADFIALGQNARDRMLHDNVSAQWRVIFRLLRD